MSKRQAKYIMCDWFYGQSPHETTHKRAKKAADKAGWAFGRLIDVCPVCLKERWSRGLPMLDCGF